MFTLLFPKRKDEIKMKKLLCFVLAAVLCLGSIPAFADVEGTVQGDIMLTSETEAEVSTTETVAAPETSAPMFSDIVSGSVLGEAVNKLVEKKVLAGYPDGTFRPNAGLTRAELSKIVNLVFELTEKSSSVPFKDVTSSEWYYDYVSVAVKAGYIKGFQDNTFRGDDPVTREQVCAILNRVSKEHGAGLFDLPFTDNIMDPVSDWAVEDVKKIIANYIMPLEADGRFRATENITRAELVLAIVNFIVEIPKVTVTFETNGGDPMEEVLVEQGSVLTQPATPVKKNNTFIGWFTDKALKKPFDFNTIIIEDITLYAKWTPNATVGVGTGGSSYTPSTPNTNPDPDPEPTPDPETGIINYTIKFYTNGGSSVERQIIPSGGCVERPADPEKEFNIFMGWYRDVGLTNEYDFSTPVRSNFTLYAKWEEDGMAITEQRVADLRIIRQVLSETEFSSDVANIIKDMTLETIDLVIADGESGIDISGDYIADTYGDRISTAKGIYDTALQGGEGGEKEQFISTVYEMIYECRERGVRMSVSEIYRFFFNF